MQAPDRIAELLFKHIRQELTPAEQLELESWKMQSSENESLFKELVDEAHIHQMIKEIYPVKEAIWNKLVMKAPELGSSPVKKMKWKKPLAVAAALVIICSGLYMYFHRQAGTIRELGDQPLVLKNDIAPGTNKAILTLANGSTIMLDSAHNGNLAQQGNAKVVKSDSGQIAYTSTGQAPIVSYNMLSHRAAASTA